MSWIQYPWLKLKPGQSVFIPCLDIDRVIADGVRSARKAGLHIQAVPGVRDGKLGVQFTRLLSKVHGSFQLAESDTSSDPQSDPASL